MGDHAQLPPVCPHVNSGDQGSDEAFQLCQQCHIAHSTHWQSMTKVHLTCQPRFSADPGYAEFLNLIRSSTITEAQLCQYLSANEGVKYISEEAALALVSSKVRALCSHRADVNVYNAAAVSNTFSALDLVEVALETNASNIPDLAVWLENDRFHSMRSIAIDARVVLNENIDIAKGKHKMYITLQNDFQPLRTHALT